MQKHFLHENFTGILHTHGHHGKAIANKNNFHTRDIRDMPTGEVMSRKDSDGFALFIHGA